MAVLFIIAKNEKQWRFNQQEKEQIVIQNNKKKIETQKNVSSKTVLREKNKTHEYVVYESIYVFLESTNYWNGIKWFSGWIKSEMRDRGSQWTQVNLLRLKIPCVLIVFKGWSCFSKQLKCAFKMNVSCFTYITSNSRLFLRWFFKVIKQNSIFCLFYQVASVNISCINLSI